MKYVKALLLAPVALLALAFALANRHSVELVVDPLGLFGGAKVMAMPLFMLFFVLLGLGVVVGGVVMWVNQGVHRKAERALQRENLRLLDENAALRREGKPASDVAETLSLASPF